MAFIDSTVVNVALPALQASLHTTVVGVQWVVESYGLFLGALILVGGSLGDLFGRRSMFLRMWLASVPRVQGLFKSMSIYAPLNTPRRFELNIFTYGLGHLVIQTAGCGWKKKALRRHAKPPVLTQSNEWNNCSTPFWPNCKTPVQWPPAEHMGDQVIDAFVERWTNLSRGW
jgi:hypothetical protein